MAENIHATLAGLTANIDDLEHYARNPRRGDLDTIVESLRRNGQYRPIVVNRRTSEVLAGNHTLAAAVKLGWQRIAVTYVDVDHDQAARIVAVDNRANDLAGYDDEQLIALLSDLPDLEGTGYSQEDLDELLAAGQATELPPALTDPDDVPHPPKAAVSASGDVWLLGPHRVLCGDSTDMAAVEAMLDGDRADCMWTDPPYGVDYVGKTKDALTIQNDGASGLPELLAGAFATATAALKPGSPFYIAHPAGALSLTFAEAILAAGWSLRQQLVWVKNSFALGHNDYHYRHEPIWMGYTDGGAGRRGRGGDAWHGDNSQDSVFEVDKPARNGDHPTMKPVELIVRMLGNSCPPRGLVYEPFGGSGSTLIAAHQTGRVARVVELDPRYVDVICRRYQQHTGTQPILQSTGKEHDFTANT